MRSPREHLGLLLLAALPACPQQAAPAQKPPSEEQPTVVFRTEANLALVRFHVLRKGKYVEDLRAEDIQLLEEGVRQKVAVFEGPGSGLAGGRSIPVEVVLLFDVSLSVMNWNLLDTLSIKETLLDGLGDHVGVAIYAFAAKLKRFSQPTADVEKLKQALSGVYDFTHSGTRLYEAIMQTARDAAGASTNASRVMLVFSDGFSTTKTRPEAVVSVAKAYGIPLYPVVLGHDRIMKQAAGARERIPPSHEARGRSSTWGSQLPSDPRALERQAAARDKETEMAEFAGIGAPTGGRSFDPPMVNNAMIRKILQALVAQIRAEYVAGYYPAAPGDNKQPHRVQAMLLDKGKGRLYGGARVVLR